MNCRQAQAALWDSFGTTDLSPVLAEHVNNCPACKAIWMELQTISAKMGNDMLFYPDTDEVTQLSAQVDTAISYREQSKPRGWQTMLQYLVPIAASLLLLMGIAIVGSRIQPGEITSETENIAYIENDEVETEELDENTISILLEDFSAYHEIYSSELLLDDLSDEELEYLVKNMDIGELM